jgi:hypothetical protein
MARCDRMDADPEARDSEQNQRFYNLVHGLKYIRTT